MNQPKRKIITASGWAALGLLTTPLVFPACGQKEYPPAQLQGPSMGGQPTLGPEVNGPIVVERAVTSTTGEGGSGGKGEADPAGVTLAICSTEAGESISSIEESPILDDFEDGDLSFAANGRVGTWYNYGDDYGTLIPQDDSSLVIAPGRGGSEYALHGGGVDFTEWGAGLGVTLARDSAGLCLHDLSTYSGITFWARGYVETIDEDSVIERDRGVVRLLLTEADVTPVESGGGCDGTRGGCWDSHRARFEPEECWKKFSFDFDELTPDGWGHDGGELDLDEIYNLGFEVSAHNDWELWVDDISFYLGDKPSEEEDCDLESMGDGGASGEL